jgi:hypothetical protein
MRRLSKPIKIILWLCVLSGLLTLFLNWFLPVLAFANFGNIPIDLR